MAHCARVDATATTSGYCSGCRVERRLRFAGYASDGRENTVRPRAFYRACATCSTRMLVLGDAVDALGLARNAIRDWLRASGADAGTATGDPARRTIDLDDLLGELSMTLWNLYGTWDPARLSFTSYASGLLPRRVASYVRDAVGSDALYRHNGRSLVKVWPKAHAASACISIEGAAEETSDEDRDDRRPDRLARALGAGAGDGPDDRSPDLGRMLARRGRQ